jgi:protein involved in polysaccharide export with SLBB domain
MITVHQAESLANVQKLLLCVCFCLCLNIAGCGPKPSSPEQVDKFEKAGLSTAGIEPTERIKFSKASPYRVIPGDILEFQMPTVLRITTSDLSEWLRPAYGQKEIESYKTRVGEDGCITLPIIEKLNVAGKTLAEIEHAVIDGYYPKYVVSTPMVVCEVSKYKNENRRIFAVMGLVRQPNTFPYPPDVQYSLLEAVAFAGGLNMVADPRYLKIYRQNADGEVVSATFGIDSKSMVQASKVIVQPGDIIYVDHTMQTRLNQFLADVLQIRVGADVTHTSSN